MGSHSSPLVLSNTCYTPLTTNLYVPRWTLPWTPGSSNSLYTLLHIWLTSQISRRQNRTSSFSTPHPWHHYPTASPALCPAQEMEAQLAWFLRLLPLFLPLYSIHPFNSISTGCLRSKHFSPSFHGHHPSPHCSHSEQLGEWNTEKSHWSCPQKEL